ATEAQKEYQLLPSGDSEDTLENTNDKFSNQKEVVNYYFIIAASFALGISQNQDDQHTIPPPTTATGPTILHSFNMSSTMFGMILTSFATFGYACVYVVSDQIFIVRVPNELPPSPEKACFL
ncbi:9973_t:CDS:2, partial [Racocetra fulgida]